MHLPAIFHAANLRFFPLRPIRKREKLHVFFFFSQFLQRSAMPRGEWNGVQPGAASKCLRRHWKGAGNAMRRPPAPSLPGHAGLPGRGRTGRRGVEGLRRNAMARGTGVVGLRRVHPGKKVGVVGLRKVHPGKKVGVVGLQRLHLKKKWPS